MTAKCHIPISDLKFYSMHTPNGGRPPAGHNPAPQIITDPELIAQLRNAMSPNPTKKNQRKTPRVDPAKHQQKVFVPLALLEQANADLADGIYTLAELAKQLSVHEGWLKNRFRQYKWPTQPQQVCEEEEEENCNE